MTRTPLRFATLVLPLLLPVSLNSAPAVADDPIAAIPVSPGDSQAGALIGNPCPSFSWGAVEGAQRYELAIFDAQWDDSPGYAEQARQGIALRRIEIDAPALSWTPAGSECLDEGGSYLWFVRAETAAGGEPWSAPRYFAIDYDADALTQTVRRELAAQLSRPEVWREVIQSALSTNDRLVLTPLALGAVAPAREADGTAAAGAKHGGSEFVTEPGIGVLATFPNPLALKINSPNGVVFNQSATGGGIPAEGSGTRFMWYPGKGALRAGYVNGKQWNDANVGFYSVATGESTTASGHHSTAMGIYTEASNEASTALGEATVASGVVSTAMGFGTAASGLYSTAMGGGTKANGYYSTAMGYATSATGDYSISMGYQTTAQSYAETAIGSYNTLAWSYHPDVWVSTDRLFVIGNGDGIVYSDALTVHKNGNLTIAGLAYKPGGGTWTNSSDARLKDITGPYERGLAEIAALQPVRYHYAVGNARGHDPEPEYVGFIAQQAQAVFPEAVSEGADGYLDFNMHAVNVAMVNAIQTLGEQISGQQDLITKLKTQNQSQQDLLQTQQAQIAALHKDNTALAQRLSVQESQSARLVTERAEEMALIRSELQRLGEQVSAQPSMQRTAVLP